MRQSDGLKQNMRTYCPQCRNYHPVELFSFWLFPIPKCS